MKTNSLFELIKKLGQAEKSYFKKLSGQFVKTNTGFFQLFTAIDKQKIYDEAALKRELGPLHFAQRKKHLHEKLMEALRSYHGSYSIESRINACIENFNILRAKGMYIDARKILEKAKRIAKENGYLSDIVKIGKYESVLLKEEDNIDQLNNYLSRYQSTSKAVNEDIQLQIELEKLHVSIVIWNKKIEWIRSDKESTELKAIINSFEIPTEALKNPESEAQRQYIIGVYHYFLCEFELSAEAFKKQFSLYETYSFLQNDQFNFIRCLANNTLLSVYTDNGFFIKNYTRLIDSKLSQRIAIQYQNDLSILLYLMYLCKIEDYAQAGKWIDKNEIQINSFEKTVINKHVMYSEFTLLTFFKVKTHLGNNSPKLALKAINNYLNNAQKELKHDSYCLARTVNLLVHFELENFDLLEYELASTKNYLTTKSELGLAEQESLTFIGDSIQSPSKSDLLKYLLDYKKQLTKVKSMKYESITFEFFDFITWTDRMIAKYSENRG
ncbi:MAG: hypothetical protein HRT57_05695 [Crocinitomicaceae bacterium]|nr:hypothetical protein [Crocinitomicaceae bacterium]